MIMNMEMGPLVLGAEKSIPQKSIIITKLCCRIIPYPRRILNVANATAVGYYLSPTKKYYIIKKVLNIFGPHKSHEF